MPLGADDEVTRVGLILPFTGERLVDMDWPSLVYGEMPADSMVVDDEISAAGYLYAPHAGLAVLDLRRHGDADYGLDLRGQATGAVKLGVTIGSYASGDDSFYFYDQVQPIAGQIN